MHNPVGNKTAGTTFIQMCEKLQEAKRNGTLSEDQQKWMNEVQARALKSNYEPPTDTVELRNPPKYVID